jgi:hypothetical protein
VRNSKKSFAKVDKYYDLKDRVGIHMDKLYLVIIQEPAREVASRESKSVLERGKHHNLLLFGVGISSPAVEHHYSTTRSGRK